MSARPASRAHCRRPSRAPPTPRLSRAAGAHDPAAVTSAAALAALPVTRKSELIRLQAEAPPLGGFNATPFGDLARIFASPGPIHEGQAEGPDPWRFARALHATGLRRGMLLHNCFAYHFTPAGFMLEGGARALGCPVFPAGPGNTDAQARAAAHLRPACYAGTPDYLKAILEAAEALGLDLSSLRFGHVTGGAYCRRCAPSTPTAASPCCRATAQPTSAWSPTNRRRARG
jgi:phenylacetate-CoA ligase